MIFWLNSSASRGRPSARRWLVFNRGTIKYGYRHVEISNARAMEGLSCGDIPVTVLKASDSPVLHGVAFRQRRVHEISAQSLFGKKSARLSETREHVT